MTARHRTQRGFTLLEVLIAVAISMLIIAATGTVYKQTAFNHLKNTVSAQLQQSAFFTSHLLSQHVQQAGFRGLDLSLLNTRFIPIPDSLNVFPEVSGQWQQGQFIRTSDSTLSIRFNGASDATGAADNTLLDCSGNGVPAGTIMELTLSLDQERLLCTSNGVTEILLGDPDTIRISRFLVSAGIDDTDNGSIDRIVSGGAVTKADNRHIRQITLRVLMESRQKLDTASSVYVFNDTEITNSDRHYRREIVVKETLRNP